MAAPFGEERLSLVRGVALGIVVSGAVAGFGWLASHSARTTHHVTASLAVHANTLVSR